MDLVGCPYCPRTFPANAHDWTPFQTHVEACLLARADELLAANPALAATHPALLAFVRGTKGTFTPSGRGSRPAEDAPGEGLGDALYRSHDGSEVVPGVFITAVGLGRDPAWLRARGIRTVVNCIDKRECSALTPAQLEAAGVTCYLCLDMDDDMHPGYDSRILEGAEALAKARAAGEPALVHCAAGVSRSATVLISFLVRHGRLYGGEAVLAAEGIADGLPQGAGSGLPLAAAAALAKVRRPAVGPNLPFLRFLRTLDEATHGAHSVPEDLLALHSQSLAAAARTGR